MISLQTILILVNPFKAHQVPNPDWLNTFAYADQKANVEATSPPRPSLTPYTFSPPFYSTAKTVKGQKIQHILYALK